MKDKIGNHIEEGDYLYWEQVKGIVKVVVVRDGGLSLAQNDMSPAILSFQITMPIAADPSQGEVMLAEFVKVATPTALHTGRGTVQ